MLNQCMGQGKCLFLEWAMKQNRQPGTTPGRLGEAMTIAQAVAALVAAKTSGNRRPVYVKNLKYYLDRFALGRESVPLAGVTSADIEKWLEQFPVAGSRQTWLTRISTLFSFAVRREWIDKNPCSKIERVTVDKLPPQILSPGQSQLLLRLAPPACHSYVVLAMYAGIRPDEILKLDRSQIDLETRTVRVNEAKTRRRRIVPLEPRAVTLLAQCLPQAGLISPSNVTVRRFKRDVREALGFATWPKDVLRHTAASYLLAKHQDVAKVAMMLGNSPNVLMSHYHEPVSKCDAAGFWNEWPTILRGDV